MPFQPSTYRTDFPLTAHQLNQDLYSIDGSYFDANGIMFHSNRPLLFETYQVDSLVSAAKGGSFTILGGTQGDAISIIDNAALYGPGSDYPANFATFQTEGAIGPGSAGYPGLYGGWQFMFAFIPVGGFSGTANTYGVLWNLTAARSGLSNPLTNIGCMVQASTVYNNCAFACDIVERAVTSPTQIYAPTTFALDPSGTTRDIVANTVTSTGQTPRLGEIWMGVVPGYGNTVSSIPVPLSTITTSTTLSSSTMTTTVTDVFNLLNNPPMLNVNVQSTVAVTANTPRIVPFTVTPLLDNYSGFSTASSTYTVPLTGIYLAHANIIFETSWNSGSGIAGFSVNTTAFWGGAYNATPPGAQNTGISVTKILDLESGDTVSAIAQVSTTNAFGTANISRFCLAWLCPVSSAQVGRKVCDVTGFQFAAGTSPDTAVTINSNPYFAGTSSTGWAGYEGTLTITASPPAGCPYPDAAEYVNNGSSVGAIEESNAPFTINTSQPYTLSAWVYSSVGTVQAGFDWRDQYGNYQLTYTSNISVTPLTWTLISTVQDAGPSCRTGYPRIGSPNADGSTIYTTGIIVTQEQPLSPLMQVKIANDVNFLLNRPYCTVHQTTAQTGMSVGSSTSNTWTAVTMQSTVGLVHGSLGDNYAGWSTASNHYVAPVNGWYLAVTELNAATTSTANSGNSLIAAFSVPTSGGVTAPTTPDWYQQLIVTNSWTYPTGATGIGLYYLAAGETIAPVAQYKAASGTWATDVTHNFLSHFNVIWMSNLHEKTRG